MDELQLAMPAAEYHAVETHVSNSMAKVFHRSPRDYHARYIAKTIADEPSRAMDLGSVIHATVFEPGADGYAVIPDDVLTASGQRRGKAWDSFKAANAGRFLITEREWRTVLNVHDALFGNLQAADFLLNEHGHPAGQPEVSIFWNCPETRVDRKARLDMLTPPYVFDLKTTDDIERFASTANNLAYDRQAAWYLDAANYVGAQCNRFIFIVVQVTPPFHVRSFEWDEHDLDDARDEIATDLLGIANCHESGDWSDWRERGVNTIRRAKWRS